MQADSELPLSRGGSRCPARRSQFQRRPLLVRSPGSRNVLESPNAAIRAASGLDNCALRRDVAVCSVPVLIYLVRVLGTAHDSFCEIAVLHVTQTAAALSIAPTLRMARRSSSSVTTCSSGRRVPRPWSEPSSSCPWAACGSQFRAWLVFRRVLSALCRTAGAADAAPAVLWSNCQLCQQQRWCHSSRSSLSGSALSSGKRAVRRHGGGHRAGGHRPRARRSDQRPPRPAGAPRPSCPLSRPQQLRSVAQSLYPSQSCCLRPRLETRS